MRMARRLAPALLACLALATSGSALGHGADDRKRELDEKIAGLRTQVERANRREAVLTSEISAVTARIRGLQGDIAGSAARLTRLQTELAFYEDRLARLGERLRIQTQKLRVLRGQHVTAQRRLEERLIAIYESENPSTMEVVLSAASFTDLLDQLDYIGQIGNQDRTIARQAADARDAMARARADTKRTRADVGRASEAVRARTEEQASVHAQLLANRAALGDARGDKQRTLAAVNENERELMHEIEGLQRQSAALAARIRSSQGATAANPGRVSSSGLIWPVNGPVVSGFGWRWGRLHEGIDIAVPAGTPIVAAAAGTVIYAGWMDGYGNLVVVDHGGGLATAYAHQSSIGAGGGQAVGQGQVIGYVGCTGHCYGDHLHFEVRVNGSPVDPLAYL
jgi:murein DD-endopeptidase MepM/ murein hydrolase activator NlpD